MADLRLKVGYVLLGIGLGSALLVSDGFLFDTKFSLRLNDEQKAQVPWELFKYSLLTVAVGAVSIIYKYYADAIEKSKQRIAGHNSETRLFRAEIIDIYTGFKAVRRELRHRGVFNPGEPLTISKVDYFNLISEFNRLQHRVEAIKWRLELSLDFLGEDQKNILRLVIIIDDYTSEFGQDETLYDNVGEDRIVIIDQSSKLFGFFQENIDGNVVNSKFFAPMHDIRKILMRRAHRLGSVL